MSLIQGEQNHGWNDGIQNPCLCTRADEDITIKFSNIYDGKERKDAFTGDMISVPSEDVDLSTWLSVVTFFNEEEDHGGIHADVVYITKPQAIVTVRVKAMVVGTNLRDYR